MKKLILAISLFTSSIAIADHDINHVVKVQITREVPGELQTIKRTFDKDEFYMWMETKMQEGCDPYVTSVTFNFIPNL